MGTEAWVCHEYPEEHLSRELTATHKTAQMSPPQYSLPDRPPFSKSTMRFYDQAKDGDVNISEVAVFFSGYTNATWGDAAGGAHLNVTRMSSWPVWSRQSTTHGGRPDALLLTPQPLTVAADGCALVGCCDMSTCESKRFSNDNFGGQWLSADAKRLYYVQSRSLPRFPPFTEAWSIACLPESGQVHFSVFLTQCC